MCVSFRIGEKTGKLYAKTDYNEEFVGFAQNMNARWIANSKEWCFDPRDEQKVREKCVLLYGTDGERTAPTCTIRYSVGGRDGHTLSLGGRTLVRRKGRDYRVALGDGVVVLEGGFPSSGGSVKNPRVNAHDGTVLEVRDFPLALARSLIPDTAADPNHFDGDCYDWWIITESAAATAEPEAPVVLIFSTTLDDILASIA